VALSVTESYFTGPSVRDLPLHQPTTVFVITVTSLPPSYRERIFWHLRLGSLSPLTPPRTCNLVQVVRRSGSGPDVLRIPHLLAFPASFRRPLYATSYHHFTLGSLPLFGSARPSYRQLSSPHRQMLLSDATTIQQIPPLPTLSDFSPEQAPCGVPAAPQNADLQGTSALRFITPVPLNADSYCILLFIL
jgi:hypothetical protein